MECTQAEGTTLGADNGIGVAAALALLDMPKSAKLPPLECLFTIDEETGLTGMLSFIHSALLLCIAVRYVRSLQAHGRRLHRLSLLVCYAYAWCWHVSFYLHLSCNE